MRFAVIFLFFRHFWAIFSPISGREPFSIFLANFSHFGGFRRPFFHSIPGGLTRKARGPVAERGRVLLLLSLVADQLGLKGVVKLVRLRYLCRCAPEFWTRRTLSFFSLMFLFPWCFSQRIAKGAGGKGPRQKTSKIVKKCQKVFRHFSTFFAQGKKRQKSSKIVKKFFDTFRQISRGTIFPAPFGGL